MARNYVQNQSQIKNLHRPATAHLFLRCRTGTEKAVVEQLRTVEGVKEIQRTIGEFDILVKIESDDSELLKRIIKWKVMKNERIQSLLTLMCMRKSLCAVFGEEKTV